MKHLILIARIAAAAGHSAFQAEGIACAGYIAGNFVLSAQPGSSGTCSVCGTMVLDAGNGPGDIRKTAAAYFESGKCPYCGYNTVHLGCAISSLRQVNCRGCGEAICLKFAELDALVECIRKGGADSVDADGHFRALNGLEQMGHCLAILTLYSYDTTTDELELLKRFANKIGGAGEADTKYPNIEYAISCIAWVRSIFHANASELVILLMDAHMLAVALPILDMVITPYFIAQAKKAQTLVLIKLLAGYRGAFTRASSILLERIVSLTNFVGALQIDKSEIKDLLAELVRSDSCAAIRHLIGRYRFSHRLWEDEACAIIEQYAVSCAYSDETFLPLLMFLVNGNAGVIPNKLKISQLKC